MMIGKPATDIFSKGTNTIDLWDNIAYNCSSKTPIKWLWRKSLYSDLLPLPSNMKAQGIDLEVVRANYENVGQLICYSRGAKYETPVFSHVEISIRGWSQLFYLLEEPCLP